MMNNGKSEIKSNTSVVLIFNPDTALPKYISEMDHFKKMKIYRKNRHREQLP